MSCEVYLLWLPPCDALRRPIMFFTYEVLYVVSELLLPWWVAIRVKLNGPKKVIQPSVMFAVETFLCSDSDGFRG